MNDAFVTPRLTGAPMARFHGHPGYRRMFATIFRSSQLDGHVVSVKRLRPDVATVHLAWELTGQTAPDGSAMAPRKGILLLVLSEEGRGWHIQVAQATESLPGVLGPSTPDQPS